MTGSDITRGLSSLEPLTQTSSTATVGTQSKAVSTTAAAGATGGTDQTRLSAAGSLFAQGADTSDVRMDKVSALQKAIAGGTYNVSSADVADKLISSLER